MPVHVKGGRNGGGSRERCWSYAVPGMTRWWWLGLPASARGRIQRICQFIGIIVARWEGHLMGVHQDDMIMIKVSEEKHN